MSLGVTLKIDNLSIWFDDKLIIENLSFEGYPGEIIILAGPSGSGKSSVLSALLGFITPINGQIYINDVPVTAENIWDIRKQVGYVPQEPSFGESTVRKWIQEQYNYSNNRSKKITLEVLGRY